MDNNTSRSTYGIGANSIIKRRFVQLTGFNECTKASAVDVVSTAGGVGEVIVGIAARDRDITNPAHTDVLSVFDMGQGRVDCEAGAAIDTSSGAVAVTCDSVGRCIPAVTSGHKILGHAVTSASAAGTLVEIILVGFENGLTVA